MHSFMTHSLTTRYGPHDRCMPSQAVEVEWSSHTMDFYGWTSRGPLQLVMVHAVERGAMVCFVSVRVATESDRKIDLSQRVS